MHADDERITRRTWLAGIQRWSAVGGLACLTVWLGRRTSGARDAECRRATPCAACGQRGGCELPQAVRFRDRSTRKT
jgi:hypothetical protein